MDLEAAPLQSTPYLCTSGNSLSRSPSLDCVWLDALCPTCVCIPPCHVSCVLQLCHTSYGTQAAALWERVDMDERTKALLRACGVRAFVALRMAEELGWVLGWVLDPCGAGQLVVGASQKWGCRASTPRCMFVFCHVYPVVAL